MSLYCRIVPLVLLSLIVVGTAGCEPPPPGRVLADGAPLGAGPVSTTAPAAIPEQQTAKPAAEEEARFDEHYAMVLVKNSHYDEKDPVLYDSGYEENNDSCMVCHLDFEKELISSIHLEAGVTCMACHGDSEVHRSDEFNIVRPDVIWGRAEMIGFCKQCHPKHKHPSKVKAFLEKREGERRPSGRWVAANSVCTDCHGKHAIVIGEGTFK